MSTCSDSVLASPAAVVRGSVADLIDAVNNLQAHQPDSILIDQIGALEQLKAACAAAQARLTHTFAVSQTAAGAARKQSADTTRRSIAAQVALTRHDSRFHGQRHVATAFALVDEMPETLSALRRGDTTERRARIVLEQFACLTPADRRHADTVISGDLLRLGDRTAQSRAAAIAYRLDPEAVMGKIRGAVKDRHISLRPAPDTMTRLSALLPVAYGVAVYAALSKSADSTIATGDGRARGQIMADELVSRVTGQMVTGCDSYGAPLHSAPQNGAPPHSAPQNGAPQHGDDVTGSNRRPQSDSFDDAPNRADANRADANRADANRADANRDNADPANGDPANGDPRADGTGDLSFISSDLAEPTGFAAPEVDSVLGCGCVRSGGLQLNLIMTDRTLFGDDEAAHLVGHGPIPGALARALVIGNADAATKTWVRRLYTDPTGTQLMAMDSRQRLFPATAQKFLILRDQTCRTPWCDAPIRQIDHLIPFASGGPTHIGNGQGLCQACNLHKQASGWRSWANRDGTVHTNTPTGHTYLSSPPRIPASPPWPVEEFEERLAQRLLDSA
ncbi:MAG: DUF222 domain-containing protein [Nakamurella sp.]